MADRARRERAMRMMDRLDEAYPDAKVALHFSNPLEMLVATVLSAQCTDKKVNEVTAVLFKKYRTAKEYADAPEGELEADIFATGFFNQKAKHLRGIGRALEDRHGGEVPDTMEDLIALPGVARKTANIVLGNSFGKVEGIAVDTHVNRLSNRMSFTRHKDPVKIERVLMKLLPREMWFKGSYILIDHGRSVCKARNPGCDRCPVNDLCPRVGVR
ncbi:MAG: endonuclease III [Thermoplasmata archaeon]|nr:MAG: endonuclease III [Thermoplasmata archaeon]